MDSTLQEAKESLEAAIKTIQSSGEITVIGWADGCVSVKANGEDLVVEPTKLLPAAPEGGVTEPPAPPTPAEGDAS